MIGLNLLKLSTILYLASVTGFEAKKTLINEDLVTYIKYEKYRNSQTNQNIPTSRQILSSYPVRHFFRPGFASNFGFCFGFNCGAGYSSTPQNIAIHNHNVADTGSNNHPSGGNKDTAVNNFHNYGSGWGGQSYSGSGNGNGNGNFGNNGWNNNNGWGYPSFSPYPYFPQAYSFPGYPNYSGYSGPGNNRPNTGPLNSNSGTTSVTTTSNNSNTLGGSEATSASTGPVTITIPNNNTIVNNINIMTVPNPSVNSSVTTGVMSPENENTNIIVNDITATDDGIDSNTTISATDGNINITISEINGDENVTVLETNENGNITVLKLDESMNITVSKLDTNMRITVPQLLNRNENGTILDTITDPKKDIDLNVTLPVIEANAESPASENIELNVGSHDEPPVNQPKPINNHYQHWNGVKDSTLSGNCIGSNVCNGAGSGVKNKKGSKPPPKDQHGLSALPINFSFDPSIYLNYYYKPNRKQGSNKDQNIKTQTTTEKPDFMKDKIPNLTQYILQPNAYVNTAPNFVKPYSGVIPSGQYQYPNGHISSDSFVTNNQGFSYSKVETPQYQNGHSFNSPQYYYAQNIQPNYHRYYPPFRYQ